MVKAMNTFRAHWSQTSARLMNACPRAWAMTYGQPQRHPFRSVKAVGRAPKNLDEVMLRAMRSAWAKKTSDLYQRKIWTKAYTSKVLTRLANDALVEHGIGVPMLLRRQKIERAVRQLRMLDGVHALRPLVEGEPRRWAFFDRREPAEVSGMNLYAARPRRLSSKPMDPHPPSISNASKEPARSATRTSARCPLGHEPTRVPG